MSSSCCIVCDGLDSGSTEAIARKRATSTAHQLATREAEKGDKRFSFVELYMLFFQRIYEHEYTRNLRVERERLTYRLSVDPVNKDKLCSYHSEFSIEFKTEVMKDVEKEYARTKWRPTH